MTKQREFKALVRERMETTGERYTAARAQLLAKLHPSSEKTSSPGVFTGYSKFGGICGDTAALTNVLRHAGIINPLTHHPYDECTVNGLCGGPGFLYGVFEYKGRLPTMTIVLRSRSMPDAYIAAGLARVGVKLTEKTASTPAAGRKVLQAVLDDGRSALCSVDVASLPWHGLPKEMAGMGPHVVGVAGRDGEDVWLDDRAPRPLRAPMQLLDEARARYRAGKFRLTTIDGPKPGHDAKQALRDAIADTAGSYRNYAVPKSFQSNCGLAGMEKLLAALTDKKDKKGWPAVFGEGARAYAGLHRLYDCLQFEYTAPAGGRAWYADFLESAAGQLDDLRLKEAAQSYRAAGRCLAEAASLIAATSDAALRKSCELAERRMELFDDDPTGGDFRDLWLKRRSLSNDCRLTAPAALGLFGELATVLGQWLDFESAAARSLVGG